MEAALHQQGVSCAVGNFNLSVFREKRCVPQCLVDVIRLEIRVCLEYLLFRHAIGHHPDNSGDRNPEASDTRNSTHLVRFSCNPIKHCEAPLSQYYMCPTVIVTQRERIPIGCRAPNRGCRQNIAEAVPTLRSQKAAIDA